MVDLERLSVADLKELCAKVEKVALQAGEKIAEQLSSLRKLNIKTKGLHDFVTNVDKASEQLIVPGLRHILPDVGILSEEGAGTPLSDGYNWIIDPLDGTTNFIHTMPPFAVSIGLAKGNDVLLGVVYEVTREEIFSAVKGGGAFCNGQMLSTTPCMAVDDALIATGFPYYDYDRLPQFMETLEYFMRNSHGMRRLGSAATDLVYVACGRVDAFYEYGLKPWDVAAGIIIAREAGARFSDYEGGNNYLYGGELLCAAPSLFPEFQEIIMRIMRR